MAVSGTGRSLAMMIGAGRPSCLVIGPVAGVRHNVVVGVVVVAAAGRDSLSTLRQGHIANGCSW